MNTEWAELLDEITEFLDGQADVLEGELPNKAMRLHMALRDLRPKVEERAERLRALLKRAAGRIPHASLIPGLAVCPPGCGACAVRTALAEMERGK